MKTMLNKLKTLTALALAFSPTIALAHPVRTSVAHVRPNLFHDRTPQDHSHSSVAHH